MHVSSFGFIPQVDKPIGYVTVPLVSHRIMQTPSSGECVGIDEVPVVNWQLLSISLRSVFRSAVKEKLEYLVAILQLCPPSNLAYSKNAETIPLHTLLCKFGH